MPPVQIDPAVRVWEWDGHTVDLLAGEDTPPDPPTVAAAVLAVRDAENPEDHDVAELLVWSIDTHPPWNGGCDLCRTPGRCADQDRAFAVAVEWLARKSNALIAQSRRRIAALDAHDLGGAA